MYVLMPIYAIFDKLIIHLIVIVIVCILIDALHSQHYLGRDVELTADVTR